MRIPTKWLKEWVETELSPEEIAEILTNLGFETTIEDLKPQGIDDFSLDIEVTSNRGDCLSVKGIARELAAATGAKFLDRAEEYSSFDGEGPKIEEVIAIEILDLEGCPRYCAMAVLGVELGPSPQWIQKRLLACGIQPISNIVDVTNYVMLELGQPLHAFDLDTLRGRKILVRRAKEGERLLTLDQVERQLSPSDLVIADAERAVALAGVMGGLYTGVAEFTRNILLEGANFDHALIRHMAKRLGMTTEASYRFERQVDPELPPLALKRAARLIAEFAGGKVAKGVADFYLKQHGEKVINFRLYKIPELLGAELPIEEVERILSSLGFEPKGQKGRLMVKVPSWRPDVEGEADLVEEVARVYGYGRLPSKLPDIGVPQGWLCEGRKLEKKAQEIMASLGFYEAVTYSLIGPEIFDLLLLPQGHPWRRALRVRNPMAGWQERLRTLVLPCLLQVVSRNITRGNEDLALFEVGRVFLPFGEGELPEERRHVCALMTGSLWRGRWNIPPEAASADFYALKGALEQFLERMGVKEVNFESVEFPMLHPTRAAKVIVEGEEVGWLGEVHPKVLENFEIPRPVWAFEVDLEKVAEIAIKVSRYRPIPKFPAAKRDLSFLLPEGVLSDRLLSVIINAGGDTLELAEIFDLYRGPQVPEGKKSVAVSLFFRSTERTLSDEEVEEKVRRLVEAVERELGGKLRGM